MQIIRDNYLTAHRLKLTRDAEGAPAVQFHTDGGPCSFSALHHTEAVDAFHRIAQDRANKIVILTGSGKDFVIGVDWWSFGDVANAAVSSQIHGDGAQVLENIANIRVPVIAAIEGRAHIHSDYVLLRANVVVAAEGPDFQDVGHYAAEVVPHGKALSRAPEATRRNTRIRFIPPLKERIAWEAGYAQSLEGASSAAFVRSSQVKREPVPEKRESA